MQQGDMYGPQFLIEYGIIIVTVNYRLGPLGQLSLDTEKVSGNQVISLMIQIKNCLSYYDIFLKVVGG